MGHRHLARARFGFGLAAAAMLLACGPPPFAFTVTFPGEASLEVGAPIRYQGVDVGSVRDVTLGQADPEQPARVEVACAIHDPEITIRRDDLFEIVSDGMLGENYLRITPVPQSSPALAAGSTVAGVPPFVTRVRESAEETLDSIESFAKDTAGSWLEALTGDDEAPLPEEAPSP